MNYIRALGLRKVRRKWHRG